jgi:anti-sigma regulatory factor (Ser/Thr protein kinase)
LRVWRDNRYVICEVNDLGHITDPLAGRRPAAIGQLGGRGLLLVNHLADLVRLHSGPVGTTVQTFMLV